MLNILKLNSFDKGVIDLRSNPEIQQAGACVRQGKIYIVRLNECKSTYINLLTTNIHLSHYTIPKLTNQLLEDYNYRDYTLKNIGVNTKLLINPNQSNSLLGPVIKSGCHIEIAHPIRKTFILPRGAYLVLRQRQSLEQV